MSTLIGTINAPEMPSNIPQDSQWIGGEGAGTWFHLSKPSNLPEEFRIRRFSPEGILECDRTFILKTAILEFDLSKPYQFTYLSHCQKCTILQFEKEHIFISSSL